MSDPTPLEDLRSPNADALREVRELRAAVRKLADSLNLEAQHLIEKNKHGGSIAAERRKAEGYARRSDARRILRVLQKSGGTDE